MFKNNDRAVKSRNLSRSLWSSWMSCSHRVRVVGLWIEAYCMPIPNRLFYFAQKDTSHCSEVWSSGGCWRAELRPSTETRPSARSSSRTRWMLMSTVCQGPPGRFWVRLSHKWSTATSTDLYIFISSPTNNRRFAGIHSVNCGHRFVQTWGLYGSKLLPMALGGRWWWQPTDGEPFMQTERGRDPFKGEFPVVVFQYLGFHIWGFPKWWGYHGVPRTPTWFVYFMKIRKSNGWGLILWLGNPWTHHFWELWNQQHTPIKFLGGLFATHHSKTSKVDHWYSLRFLIFF